MAKSTFQIQKGIPPARRGPKAKIDYDALFEIIPQMTRGDSILITNATPTTRNSTYLTITEVFGRRLDKVEDEGKNNVFQDGRKLYEVKSSKVDEDRIELRVFRIA